MARSSRRSLLAGSIAIPLTVGAAIAAVSPGADAELIRLCDEYLRALAAYDRDGGHVESADDPLCHALEALEQKLDGLEARTMEGVIAKARVALFSAQQLDGSEDFSTSYTGDWPEQVIRDLLRLHGQATV